MGGANFALFLLAAVVIAIVPGPSSPVPRAGVTSTFGTAVGGLVHVVAGGFGVSAIILASAQLFARRRAGRPWDIARVGAAAEPSLACS
jgi:threonine/homoserine/homoserine lactone efflux protein